MFAVEGRFGLLPPIREVAAFLVEGSGRADRSLEALVAWVLEVAADPEQSDSSNAIAANLDTCIRVAWLAVRHPTLRRRAGALADALFGPMYDHLRQRELLALLEAVLADAAFDRRGYAETARRAAICASECDTIAHARRWLDRAHELAAELDNDELRSRNWSVDAWLSLDIGDHAKAIAAAERSMSIAAPHDPRILYSMRCIAEAALASGDLERAEQTAAAVIELAGGASPLDGLLARTTLGWCLVERGRWAEAVAHAQRLADDVRRHQADLLEIAVEAELIALGADPRVEPRAPSLDNDQRFSWWMRLQQRIRLVARLPIDEHYQHVMHTAADVVVLADLVPLGYPRICATNLLGDAALASGDLRHATRAYEQALRDAARGPYRLRGADAFDGLAVTAERMGHHVLAGTAATAAAHTRELVGAAAWPRPSLPVTVTASGSLPDTWLRDGTPTSRAIDEITHALQTFRRPDPLASLTPAERHVAQLVRQGMTNNQIADHLVISRRTVESHLARVFRKLDIRNRTQLATLPIAGQR